MRPLSSTLRAAQQQSSARPYVSATFSDYHGDTSRLRFQRHYTGAEGEYYAAATMAPDGSLVRARIDPATKVLYTSRVANPGPGSTYSAWTSQGTVSASGAVALCASAAAVSLFYVDADTLTLKTKQSTDNGATFGSASTVATALSAVTYLAAGVASSGQTVLFWTVGAVVWRSRLNAGVWGTPAVSPHSVASVTGIACTYHLDFNLVVCGTETTAGDAKVWTTAFGDAGVTPLNTWGPLLELTTATSGSGVTFHAPALARLEHWRLFFVEKYSGTQAYARLHTSVMHGSQFFDGSVWREPAAFDYAGDYGVAAVASASQVWLTAAAGVWAGSLASPATLDVSADVVEAHVDLDETSGRARLVLRNDAPSGPAERYANYGEGTLSTLRRGTKLTLGPGYYTAAGPEASIGDEFWVESIEQTTGAEARLVVQARDGWWLLERWRARRQYVWSSGADSVSNILAYVCNRAGLGFAAIDGSAALFALTPQFTINPGESARTAVLRLAAIILDRLVMRGSVLCTRQVAASDAPDYEHGTSHAIVSARYVDNGPEVNRARVIGAGAFNEGFDFAEIEAVGERTSQVADRNLTTAAQTIERAMGVLREAALARRQDGVQLAGVNVAQEIHDTVSLTDAQAGLTSAKRRVRALSWRYVGHGAKPRYDMTLTLGEP